MSGAAVEVLGAVRAAGGDLLLLAGSIRYQGPQDGLTDELRTLIRQHKAELVSLLSGGATALRRTAPTPAAAVVCQRCGGPLKDGVEEAWRLHSLCRSAWQRGEA